jgi:hypothetical protein
MEKKSLETQMEFNPHIIFHPDSEMLSQDDIKKFERAIGYTLPNDYAAFMLAYNGGTFDPQEEIKESDRFLYSINYDVPDLDGKPYSFDISDFKSISENPRRNHLFQVYQTMLGWFVPKELLPFATTAANVKIFLSLDEKTKGQVMIAGETYLDKYEAEEKITLEDFTSIAPSFSAFMKNLYWEKDTSI